MGYTLKQLTDMLPAQMTFKQTNKSDGGLFTARELTEYFDDNEQYETDIEQETEALMLVSADKIFVQKKATVRDIRAINAKRASQCRSDAKAAAARKNGKKGGRPRKEKRQ